MRLIQVTRRLDEIERRLVQLEDGAMAEDRAASEERMT